MVGLSRTARGGRPLRGMSPALSGRRPAARSDLRSKSSIWAVVLRSSSAAQRARASYTAGSTRRRTLLRSGTTAALSGGSVVEGAGIDDRFCRVVAAQYDQQVADHGGF